jgi:hypothetical protein
MSGCSTISKEEEKYYAKILQRPLEEGKDLLDATLPSADITSSSKDAKDASNPVIPGITIFRKRTYADENVIGDLIDDLSHEEIIQRCFEDLNFLAKFLSPQVHVFDFPPIIVEMWKLVVSGILSLEEFMGEARYGLGMPRGIGKTQFIKYLMWWTLVFTNRNFILLVTSIEDNGAETIKDVMGMMDQQHVINIFGNPKNSLDVDNKTQKRFEYCGKECILLVKPIMSAARGLNLDETRPGLIILDDAQTEENARSKVQSEALNAWIMSTLILAGPQTGTVVLFVGNTYMFEGSILTKLINNPEWATLTIGFIKADGTSIWEEVHPIKKILASFKQAVYFGIEDRWLAQMMNMTDLHENDKFKEELVDARYAAKFGSLSAVPVQDKEFNVVLIDPSGYKKTSDDVSLINLTITSSKEPVITHHITKQMNPEKNILEAMSLALRTGASVIMIESVAYQDTLGFWLKKYLKKYNMSWLKILKFHPGTASKEIRILSSFDRLYSGDAYISSKVLDDYKRQARAFNPMVKDNKDDLLDIVASAFKLWYQKSDRILEIARQALLAKMIVAPKNKLTIKDRL